MAILCLIIEQIGIPCTSRYSFGFSIKGNDIYIVIIVQLMLEGKELDRLFEILQMKEQSVEEIQGKFLISFNESMHVFKASLTMSHLMTLNLLTCAQRIMALFLLIENYKSQGIKKHPFGLPILNISLLTVEPFERRMIADLIIDSNREKYLNATLHALEEEALAEPPHTERTDIQQLRKELENALPHIYNNNQREFYPKTNNTDSYPPEQDEHTQSVAKAHSKFNYSKIGSMRPIPSFLEVSASELSWITPGIIADASWDNSGQIQKRISKSKQLIKKGMQICLSKEDCGQIQKIFESEMNAILYLDIYPQHLLPLIRYNPQVVALFLIKLSNYPIFGLYLDTLINLDLSLNIIEVVSRILKCSRLPNEFYELFVYKNIKSLMRVLSGQQIKLLRIFSNFVRVLLRNKVLKIYKIKVQLQAIINKYVQFQEMQKLRLVVNEQLEEQG